MKNSIQITIASVILMICGSCIKQEDPCHGDKHIKANFYMEEICTNNVCPDFWQDYKTAYCSSGWIRFTSNSTINASIIPGDTASYEWHIGAGVYHGSTFSLNFGNAPDGAVIPVMLIIREKPDSLCIPNDNGVDTIIKNLTIDFHTHLCYGTWKGAYTDSPSDTSTILIAKGYSASFQDSTPYVKYLYPATVDTLMGYSSNREDFRQEISIVLGSNIISAYGNAMTDSSGQNITIYYDYALSPSTTYTTRTFKGVRR